MKPQAVFDIECYKNYFLVMFMRLSDNVPVAFERTETDELDTYQIEKIINKYEIIGFNSNSYDIPLLKLALKGASCRLLKHASDDLIENDIKPYKFTEKYELPETKIDTVDIIEICKGKASLKVYGGRLHCRKLQDLPIEPSAEIFPEDRKELQKYCYNDLTTTARLLEEVTPHLNLRREMGTEYGIDLRSKSDAQIAEAVIKSELERMTGVRVGKISVSNKEFWYDVPEFIVPYTNKLNKVLEILDKEAFIVNNVNGKIEMPKELADMKISIGSSVYQMGIGGLHSTEHSVYHLADKNTLLCDWDVASYYPSIILNCELFPRQLGRPFLDVYKKIVDERLEAKKLKNKVKADSLKITINGSFGKLGSPYSALYSPKLMIQVTVTGQLALLCLIDRLEAHGIPVVSGNTDGIVLKCPINKETKMKEIIKWWEELTGFVMERADYSALYSRDVNNYIAVKTDGKVKTKGCFSSSSIDKNPQNEICYIALIKYLTENVPFIETIKDCRDITKFVTVRNVKGGAVKGRLYLGKAVRWYYARNINSTINYKSNGNTVPRTFGARPLMEITGLFPGDVDYSWYERECNDLLVDIGMKKKGQMELF